jgi:hypothetical protein
MGFMQPSEGLAKGALVTGVLALPGACCCYSSIPLGLAAIIMGSIALNRAKLMPGAYGGRQMALAGIICGGVGLALSVAMALIGASGAMDSVVQHLPK